MIDHQGLYGFQTASVEAGGWARTAEGLRGRGRWGGGEGGAGKEDCGGEEGELVEDELESKLVSICCWTRAWKEGAAPGGSVAGGLAGGLCGAPSPPLDGPPSKLGGPDASPRTCERRR